MKETDIIGFSVTAFILLIFNFIFRQITFPYLWLKIVCSILIPFCVFVFLAIVVFNSRLPLYVNGIVGLTYVGVTIEMFVLCKVKKKSK